MKIVFFIFMTSLLLSQEYGSQLMEKRDSINVGEDTNGIVNSVNQFEIVKVDSVERVYIIYAKRRDSIIKIVSGKEEPITCKPIVQGEYYDLEVKSLLELTSGKRHVGGIKYNGVIIKLEGDKVVWDLFICENLKGLCLYPISYSN